VPADAYVGPTVPGYRTGSCGETCMYDPAKAKALLSEAGGLDAIKVTYNADGPHKEWVEGLRVDTFERIDKIALSVNR
jgi:oligopeptide transport system substrate-binding protein